VLFFEMRKHARNGHAASKYIACRRFLRKNTSARTDFTDFADLKGIRAKLVTCSYTTS